jgi:hypothetical protein
MQSFPLRSDGGHLFATVGGHDWLLDTGAPTSFGNVPSLNIGERNFHIPDSYMGLNAATLAGPRWPPQTPPLVATQNPPPVGRQDEEKLVR